MVKAEYTFQTAPMGHVLSSTSVSSGNTGNPHVAVATHTLWARDFPPSWAQTLRSDTQTLRYIMQYTTASQYTTAGAIHEVLSFKRERFESKVMLII